MKINYLFNIALLLFLMSCTTFEDAGKVLRNEKLNTTDEFLVKKNQPLIIPPDFNTLPKPSNSNNKSKEKDIQKIFNSKQKNETTKSSSALEKSILNEIK